METLDEAPEMGEAVGCEPAEKKKSKMSRVNMTVIVRVRPLQPHERRDAGGGHQAAVKVVDDRMLVFDPADEQELNWNNRRKSVFNANNNNGKFRDHSMRGRPHRDLRFAFDRVFGPDSSNKQIFDDCVRHEVLDALLDGFNCSVFAYGATGAGKTFTMLGNHSSPGIMYRTVKELYERIETMKEESVVKVQVTYIEIYNEEIKDLINESAGALRPLKIWEDGNGEVTVGGVSYHTPATADALLQMLERGNRNRTQHPTDANQESSRSHAVFQIFVTRTERAAGLSQDFVRGKMALVDLAGSERATMLATNSGERMREGANINRSLLALGNCINALADPNQRGHYVNYRDSNLTRLLKDSLCGNSRTVMIAAVSPSWINTDDTHNTLNYANRAKNIRCHVTRNVVSVDSHVAEYAEIVRKLKEEVEMLKSKIKRQEIQHRNENFSSSRRHEETDPLSQPEVQAAMQERADLRRKHLTVECGAVDVEAKLSRKRKLVERMTAAFNPEDDEDIRISAEEDLRSLSERAERLKRDGDDLSQRLRETHAKLLRVTSAGKSGEAAWHEPRLQRRFYDEDAADARRLNAFLAQQAAKAERFNAAMHDLLLCVFHAYSESHTLIRGHGYSTPYMEDKYSSLRQRLMTEDRDVAFASQRQEVGLDVIDSWVRREKNDGEDASGNRPNITESVNPFLSLCERIGSTSYNVIVAAAPAYDGGDAGPASRKTVKKSSLKSHSNRRRSYSANAVVAPTASVTTQRTPGSRRNTVTRPNRPQWNNYQRNNPTTNNGPPVRQRNNFVGHSDNHGQQRDDGKSPRQLTRRAVRVQPSHSKMLYHGNTNSNNNNSNDVPLLTPNSKRRNLGLPQRCPTPKALVDGEEVTPGPQRRLGTTGRRQLSAGERIWSGRHLGTPSTIENFWASPSFRPSPGSVRKTPISGSRNGSSRRRRRNNATPRNRFRNVTENGPHKVLFPDTPTTENGPSLGIGFLAESPQLPASKSELGVPEGPPQQRKRHRRSLTAPEVKRQPLQNGEKGREALRVNVNLYNNGRNGGALNYNSKASRRQSRIPGPFAPEKGDEQNVAPSHWQPKAVPSYMRPTAAAKKKRQSYVSRPDGISLPDKEN